MAEEDAALPRHRIVNVRTIPPNPDRSALFPPSVRAGEFNPGRPKEPFCMLWGRTLKRYWRQAIGIWLLISVIVLPQIYHPPDLSFIDARFLAAAATMACLAAAICVMLLLIEFRSGRVSDPNLLSYRMQSLAYTLPPLPGVPQSPGDKTDELIGQWVQRLDHVRFVIGGLPQAPGKGRCVQITSAVRGEGRSLLACQLAARNARTGTSTVLIDADLPNGVLNQFFDVPDGVGLTEAVAGTADFDQALIPIPVPEGTFHLLQAGGLVQDSARCIEDPMIGELIARCRERFDLTIIDCGPVRQVHIRRALRHPMLHHQGVRPMRTGHPVCLKLLQIVGSDYSSCMLYCPKANGDAVGKFDPRDGAVEILEDCVTNVAPLRARYFAAEPGPD